MSPSSHLHEEEYQGPTTELTGADRSNVKSDEERLRMLGYDTVLGRQFGFWSSMCLNICHQSVTYEFLMLTFAYGTGWDKRIFYIGYPVVAMAFLLLLAVFAEFASTFPVAGAVATWSWRSARAGIRHERQWGYLVSGFVLASHIGRTIQYAHNGANMIIIFNLTSTGIIFTSAEEQVMTAYWRYAVFTAVLVTATAVVMMSRVGRTSAFWTTAGGLYVAYVLIMLVVVCLSVRSKGGLVARGLDLVTREDDSEQEWVPPVLPRTVAWTTFSRLPLRLIPMDAPAHMSEETKRPAKTVPRAMFASTLFHIVITYVLVSVYLLGPMSSSNENMLQISDNYGAWIALAQYVGMSGPVRDAWVFGSILCTWVQVLASVLVMTRFVFALARDCAIPFSNFLVKTTKNGEPWAANLVVILALYASIAGWFTQTVPFRSLVQAFGGNFFWAVPTVMCLFLYLTSNLNLRYAERSQFTIGKFSKPFAYISIGFLIIGLVQESLPSLTLNDAADAYLNLYSYFPYCIAGMLVVMFISWFLYGRRHYIGPIRALTKWTAGVEINPMDFTTSKGRSAAIHGYILLQKGSSGDTSSTRVESTSVGSSILRRLFKKSRRGTSGTETGPRSVMPESGLLAMTTHPRGAASVVPESGLFPAARYDQEVSVVPESGLFPAATHIQEMSVIPESGIVADTDSRGTHTDHALVESQIMPTETSTRRLSRLPYSLGRRGPKQAQQGISEETEDLSYPMSPISPGSRYGIPAQAGGAGGAQRFSTAQEESQLEPERTYLDPQVESQLEPAGMEESRIDPAFDGARFTGPTPPLRSAPKAPKRWQ